VKGTKALRLRLGTHAFPIVGRGKKLRFRSSFKFPTDTPEGRAAAEAYRKFVETGEPCTLPGKYLVSFEASDWWKRLVGPDASRPEILSLGPAADSAPVETRVELDGGDGNTCSLPDVRMVHIRGGRKEHLFSSASQNHPIVFELKLNPETGEGDLGFTVQRLGRTVAEREETLRFIELATSGATLRMLRRESGRSLFRCCLRQWGCPVWC
jgi:hypothetical protein